LLKGAAFVVAADAPSVTALKKRRATSPVKRHG
jgi:hypothetical protein